MDFQSLGMIGASTTHTNEIPSQKNVQQGETQLELLATSQGTTWLELLVSPRVRTLRGMTPLNPLASSHGTTLFKPSARAWVLTSYYLWAYIPSPIKFAPFSMPQTFQRPKWYRTYSDTTYHITHSHRCQKKYLGPILVSSYQTGPSWGGQPSFLQWEQV